MSTESCLVDWQSVQKCLEASATARQEFAALWAESIDKLAEFGANLKSWQRGGAEENVQLERVRSIIDDEKRTDFVEASTSMDETTALRDRLDEANVDREQLREELESARASLESTKTIQSEYEQLKMQSGQSQTELEASQTMIEELQSELTIARNRTATTEDDNEQLQNMVQELADVKSQAKIQQQLANEFREQCQVLETELETVRSRTAELSDTLARERHQAASDRAEWADEVGRRRQKDHCAVASCNVPRLPAVTANGGSLAHASSPAAVPSDIVVESVLAQFGMIQRQRSRRRMHH